MSDMYHHLDKLQAELHDYERGNASMERQMDRLIEENGSLKREIQELKAEVVRLGGEL